MLCIRVGRSGVLLVEKLGNRCCVALGKAGEKLVCCSWKSSGNAVVLLWEKLGRRSGVLLVEKLGKRCCVALGKAGETLGCCAGVCVGDAAVLLWE